MRRPYYLFSSGRLARRHNTLALERATGERLPDDAEDDDGRPSPTLDRADRVPFPVEQVESLYLFGEVDINTKLVTFLARAGIPAFFFDYYGHFTAALVPRDHQLSGRLRVEQARHYLGPKRRMRLARAFVLSAAANIERVMRYYTTRCTPDDVDVLKAAVYQTRLDRDDATTAPDIPSLMAVEGRIRERYYRLWPRILGPHGAAFPFERRERNPPSNEMNALISFGNSLCYSLCLRQILRTALDPSIAYLHEPGDRRHSLALDLSEIFKPLLVDRAIFRLVKTGQITAKHFEPRLGGTYLSEAGRKVFVAHWDERLQKTVHHRGLDRPVSYERLVRLECYKLVRHLCDPKADPYKPFVMWW